MKPRRFGLLLNKYRCAYSYAVAEALQKAATSRQAQIVEWPVPWASSKTEVDASEFRDLLDQAEQVDGLVILASVFSHGVKALNKFVQAWWPRPASSIGYRLPLVPSVLVDNRGAMHTAAQHLIQGHGRRQILFIRGRLDSQEATDRYFGFRQALAENKILGDAVRVLEGDFTGASAVAALEKLPVGMRFDGLIASNDEMALAAAEVLEARGMRIPDDVSLIGFDDVPAAAKARVPLTTMRQPFETLTERAVDVLIEQCEDLHPPATTDVPVHFIQRASCGCLVRRP